MLEVHSGGDHRVIDDRVADDLAGGRAAKDGGAFEMAAQLTQELARLDQRSGAKDENYIIPFNFRVWQIRLPAITSRPLILRGLHDLSPS
jgi:hypothetical protein